MLDNIATDDLTPARDYLVTRLKEKGVEIYTSTKVLMSLKIRLSAIVQAVNCH